MDLYAFELETATLRRLTNDPFAELQPDWSPDGRQIAFATDRFSSNAEQLSFGDFRLALIDAAGGEVREVRTFTTGKNISPQWAADSRTLYFISDRDGIPNLYSVLVTGGDAVQLTALKTGITGITATSPALSVSTRTNVAAFSVFDHGNYSVHTLALSDAPEAGTSGPR
jgi:Tol biopolymer transport system component